MADYIYSNGELYHYGVLGMKWGRRRAQRLTSKAEKYRQSGNTAKLAKAESLEKKAKAVTDKHVKLAGGKKTYNYTTAQSTGKLVAKSLLFGTYGALKYDQAKAEHKSRGQAAVNGVLYYAGNYATVGLLGVIEPRANKR